MFTIIIFILILSILVMIHELGHFIMARRAGIGVEEFGFGLPPRIWGKKHKGTIYSINWLPFGGFVRLVGEDSTDITRDAKNSFHTKSLLARIKVVLAGVFMNLILAVFLFYILLFSLGFKTVIPKLFAHQFKNVEQTSQIVAINNSKSTDEELIRSGESILFINDEAVGSISEFENLAKVSKKKNLTLTLENSFNNKSREVILNLDDSLVLVTGTDVGSNAQKAGFEAGDIVREVDGMSINILSDLHSIVRSSEGKELAFLVEKETSGESRTIKVVPIFNNDTGFPTIGVSLREQFVFKDANGQKSQKIILDEAYSLKYNSLSQKVFSGFTHSYNTMDYSLRVFGQLIGYSIKSGDITPISEGVSGPVGIAQITGQAVSLGWQSVLQLVALLSLNLAIMNVLPIPALDGGRFFFLLIEAVTRKRVYPVVEKWVHTVGFAVLIGLILLVTYNDILKILK